MSGSAQWLMRVLVVGLLISVSLLRAVTYDVRLPPRTGDTFQEASFRLWIDEASLGGRPLQGLLVLAPGWNGDGRGLVNQAEWQLLARELNVGLVGVCMRSGHDDPTPYHMVDRGSGAAWLRALSMMAIVGGRQDVQQVPWLVWGHSAGGQWAYGLACVYPERVAGFVAVKGGIYETHFNPLARGVPGLFIIGERDEGWRAMNIIQLFEHERREGAAWAVAWERGAGHGVDGSTALARAFLRETFALRCAATTRDNPRQLVVGEGVVGIRSNYEASDIWPRDGASLVRTVWLPGPKSLLLWRELGGGGQLEVVE